MLPESFAIIGAIIGSLGGLYYLYETIVGRAQPNRVTWLLWGIFPMVIFVAQRAQGVEGLSWTSFVAGATPLLIVAASFLNKDASWRSERRDYYLMAAAITGIVLWAITDDPNLALLFALLAAGVIGSFAALSAVFMGHVGWSAFAVAAVVLAPARVDLVGQRHGQSRNCGLQALG